MLNRWNHRYNVVLKCLRGLEHNLFNELESFGIDRNLLVKSNSRIIVLGCNLKQLYFLSYFPRLCSRVYFEVGRFGLTDKKSVFEGCENIQWNEFLGSNNSYTLNCNSLANNSYINSKIYACQLVKDGIKNHFSHNLNLEPPKLEHYEPDVKLEVDVDEDCKATILVDSVGLPLSRRSYRYKPNIGDIDPTMACSILYDIGYSSFSDSPFSLSEYEKYCEALDESILGTTKNSSELEKKNKPLIVDLFSGCGVFLIESALSSARIPPGYSVQKFSFQNFPVFDEDSFKKLKKYADTKMVHSGSEEWSKLKGKFIGIERDWEKVEASLCSSENAGILDLINFNQADYLKDGLYDAKKTSGSTEWEYMIAQLPQMRMKPKDKDSFLSDTTQDTRKKEKKSLSPERYSTLLKSLSRVMNKHFKPNSKGVVILPTSIDKNIVEGSLNMKLSVGKSFNKDGICNMTYYTAN